MEARGTDSNGSILLCVIIEYVFSLRELKRSDATSARSLSLFPVPTMLKACCVLLSALALRGRAEPSRPLQAGGCNGDEDCSLNGLCTNGQCACDSPWTGPECGRLDFLPAPVQPVYGGASNASLNYSTWGGNPVVHNGTFHLFVARVPGTLALWYNTSQIDHAVSDAITGPYAFRSVVLPAFAHNPQIVHQTFKNGTEKFVLFHIGHGGTATSTSFWTIFGAFLSSNPPHTRCGPCST